MVSQTRFGALVGFLFAIGMVNAGRLGAHPLHSSYAEVMREAVDRSSEYVFLGLRLNRGIDLKTFCSKFGVRFDDRFPSVIDELKREELVFIDGDALRLTRKGMLFSNEVFQAFV